MKFRDILLFFTFLGVFIVLLNVNFSKRLPYLKLCDPQKITGFQIQKEGESFKASLNIDTGDWHLSTPEGDEAEAGSEAIALVTKFACYIPYNEKFTLEPAHADAELEAFGLAHSPKQFTVAMQEKDTVITIGHETASGSEVYLHTSQEPNAVYTVINKHVIPLSTSFLDVRLRFPFAKLDEADSVKIHFGNSELLLTRKDKEWQDENGLLPQEQVEPLIQLIETFHYTNYKGPLENQDGSLKEEFIPYDLDFPAVTLEVKSAEAQQGKVLKLVKFGSFYHLTTSLGSHTYLLVLNDKSLPIFSSRLEGLSQLPLQ